MSQLESYAKPLQPMESQPEAKPVPGHPGWAFWLEPAPGDTTGLVHVYASNLEEGRVLGPFDWREDGWFHSGKAREAAVQAKDKGQYTEVVQVSGAICDELRRRLAPPPSREPTLLINLWAPHETYTCSYLEAIREEMGVMPQGLAHIPPADYRDYDGPTMYDFAMSQVAPYLEKHPQACPFPRMDPLLHNRGTHLVAHAERLRALLADGEWHAYSEVLEVAGVPRAHRLELHDIALWGDAPYRRDWQVPVYCYGTTEAGWYALWDAPVAVAHRAARRAR